MRVSKIYVCTYPPLSKEKTENRHTSFRFDLTLFSNKMHKMKNYEKFFCCDWKNNDCGENILILFVCLFVVCVFSIREEPTFKFHSSSVQISCDDPCIVEDEEFAFPVENTLATSSITVVYKRHTWGGIVQKSTTAITMVFDSHSLLCMFRKNLHFSLLAVEGRGFSFFPSIIHIQKTGTTSLNSFFRFRWSIPRSLD